MTPLCSFLSPSMAVKESSKELVRPARDQVHHRTQQHRTTELHAEECARARARAHLRAQQGLCRGILKFTSFSLSLHKASTKLIDTACCQLQTVDHDYTLAKCALLSSSTMRSCCWSLPLCARGRRGKLQPQPPRCRSHPASGTAPRSTPKPTTLCSFHASKAQPVKGFADGKVVCPASSRRARASRRHTEGEQL